MTPTQIIWVLRIAGGIAGILALWWAWHHYVAEPYKEIGRAEVREELQPTIDALQIDKKRLQESYAQISEEIFRQNAQIRDMKNLTEQKRNKRVQAEKNNQPIVEHRASIINAAEKRETPSTCDLAVLQAQKDLQ